MKPIQSFIILVLVLLFVALIVFFTDRPQKASASRGLSPAALISIVAVDRPQSRHL